MRQLVEQREHLTRMRSAVVQVDNGEMLIQKGEAGYVGLPHSTLEDKEPFILNHGPPVPESVVCAAPAYLLVEGYAEMISDLGTASPTSVSPWNRRSWKILR